MLREIIDENRTPELPGLPTFTGGLGGYFSYDYIKYSEPKLRLSDEEKTEIKPQFSEEKYEEMIEKAKHYIREGDIFQVVLSNPMRAKAEGSLFDTYRVLRTHNPSPYMFYFSSIEETQSRTGKTVIKAFSIKTKKDVERALLSPADYILLDQGNGGSGQTVPPLLRSPYD